MYVQETRSFSYGTFLGCITNATEMAISPFPDQLLRVPLQVSVQGLSYSIPFYTISNTAPCRIHPAGIKPPVLAKTQLSALENLTLKTQEKRYILKDF